MKRLRILLAVAIVALMAGCALIPAAPDEAHEVAGMLANFERLATLKTDEQRAEFNAAQAAFERAPTDTTRLNLALALLLPNVPWRDDARVQSLLGTIRAAPGEQRSARYDFAQLLLKLVAERQRVQREEQRKEDQLGHQLREERRKAEEIQQKIDSLRSIDKDMRKRRTQP